MSTKKEEVLSLMFKNPLFGSGEEIGEAVGQEIAAWFRESTDLVDVVLGNDFSKTSPELIGENVVATATLHGAYMQTQATQEATLLLAQTIKNELQGLKGSIDQLADALWLNHRSKGVG